MSQIQRTTPKFEVVEVLKRWNISVEDVKEVIADILSEKLVYKHTTWGRCRETKILVTYEDGQYVPGEWRDLSSRKNVRKYKYADAESLRGKVLLVYVRESPSCNPAKRYSFLAKVRVSAT